MTQPTGETLHPVVSSALWAAWGDALGFITELTTSLSEVSRRSGGAKVENTVPWSRRIGGRFGPVVDLPAGAYSDDTQLRLAVSRSIRADGRFDLEAFSKIELPVFLSYEMRAGKGTKAAAYALMKRHVRWSGNFFENDRATYINTGGNGAAMRIQPHVWSAPGFNPKYFTGWVAADAIVTHGHPRGVLGAVIHANALSSVLRHGQIPRPDVWAQIVDYASSISDVMQNHEVLRERWRPTWEKTAGRAWADAVADTITEGRDMVALAREAADADDAADAYRNLLIALGGKKRETMGSGMVAAVASLFAAWAFRDDPADGLRVIANQLGTDTDTIATMAGALLGATGLPKPPGPIMDASYISTEAMRMIAIGDGRNATSFPHPDPLKWKPPRSLADAVGTTPDGMMVAGLGPVIETGGEYAVDTKDRSVFQWMTLVHGQTVLIKRRPEPKPLPPGALPVERPATTHPSGNGHAQPQTALFDSNGPASDHPTTAPASAPDLQQALQEVVDSEFDDHVIGTQLLRFAAMPEKSFERASDFAVAVTTAYRSQSSRRRDD
jgi:ADP-ribosylglycohydrolase